jgi:hypothetical protein
MKLQASARPWMRQSKSEECCVRTKTLAVKQGHTGPLYGAHMPLCIHTCRQPESKARFLEYRAMFRNTERTFAGLQKPRLSSSEEKENGTVVT